VLVLVSGASGLSRAQGRYPQQVTMRLDAAVPVAVNPIVTELPGALLTVTWAWKLPDQEFTTE